MKRKHHKFFTMEKEDKSKKIKLDSVSGSPVLGKKKSSSNTTDDDDHDDGKHTLKCYISVYNDRIQPILKRVDSQGDFSVIEINDFFIDKTGRNDKDELIHATITINGKYEDRLKSYLVNKENF